MTTSGRLPATAALSLGKSRTSAKMERTTPATFACSNRLGWVGGSSAYPVTLAPSASSQSESQLPLKPVCPVRITRRFFQNERLGMFDPGPPCRTVGVATEPHSVEAHSKSSVGQHKLHRILPAGTCCMEDSCDSFVASGHLALCSRQMASTIPAGDLSTSSKVTTASFETSRR